MLYLILTKTRGPIRSCIEELFLLQDRGGYWWRCTSCTCSFCCMYSTMLCC